MLIRIKINVKGAVQGVGFRPFIYRLAEDLGLKGYVLNSAQGVVIEAEGNRDKTDEFLARMEKDKPRVSLIQAVSTETLPFFGYSSFEIRESLTDGAPDALVLPDIATCDECLVEIFNPADRRYLYPFTNCTNCGPRYSIIESLPYDRPATTMKNFQMCPECLAEYEDSGNRRFHAQPNACPVCGPSVELWDLSGKVLSSGNSAMIKTARAIREGMIAAVKGIGGFHLMADALNNEAIISLRRSKNREEKPFALMYPSLKSVSEDCEVSDAEMRLLTSPQSPIVLLKRKPSCRVGLSVAPGNPYLGVMLPYSPLHHILMHYLNTPVIATSGNLAEEPICTDELEALTRLKGIAELFLVHNRPVFRHVDDSIARIVSGEKVILRRARGYSPMPVVISNSSDRHILAVGGHLKNTIAVSRGNNVFISQHIGDLETKESYNSFCSTVKKFREIYKINPHITLCDSHPDYISAKYARENFGNTADVQHHAAHILSVMAENELKGSLLGVSWDGAGFGSDGTVWGGEFLKFDAGGYERAARLKMFRLPGGESSFRDIYKSACGLLYEIYGKEFTDEIDIPQIRENSQVIIKMLEKGINSPWCSSAGRLFDAVASIIGIRQKVHFEGQAAMEFEYILDNNALKKIYGFDIISGNDSLIDIDWTQMILQIIDDRKKGVSKGVISAGFHNTLVSAITETAGLLGEEIVALSGGCFQNKYLLENSIAALQKKGHRVYWNREVPANDGGISLGQIAYLSYYGNN